MNKMQVGEEGVLWLTLPQLPSSSKEVKTGTEAGKEQEAGADVEILEECCILACLISLSKHFFL